MERPFLITVDEVTCEDISPCDTCGHRFEMDEDLMLIPHRMIPGQPQDDGYECRCLDCVEAT